MKQQMQHMNLNSLKLKVSPLTKELRSQTFATLWTILPAKYLGETEKFVSGVITFRSWNLESIYPWTVFPVQEPTQIANYVTEQDGSK